MKRKISVGFHSFHKCVSYTYRYVSFGTSIKIGFQIDKLDKVWVFTRHTKHCRTSAPFLTNQPSDVAVEVHKAGSSRCAFCCIVHHSTTWSQFANIQTTAATITKGSGHFSASFKNRFQIVLWRGNNITV